MCFILGNGKFHEEAPSEGFMYLSLEEDYSTPGSSFLHIYAFAHILCVNISAIMCCPSPPLTRGQEAIFLSIHELKFIIIFIQDKIYPLQAEYFQNFYQQWNVVRMVTANFQLDICSHLGVNPLDISIGYYLN